MCGRFSRSSPADVILEELGVMSSAAVDLRPRYNVCPGDDVAAVVQRPEGRRLGTLRWGLAPRGQINLRSETLTRNAPWREALQRRRCLIVADGFYEWSTEQAARVPHFFRLKKIAAENRMNAQQIEIICGDVLAQHLRWFAKAGQDVTVAPIGGYARKNRLPIPIMPELWD